MLLGCGGKPVAFQGESTLAITGDPPAQVVPQEPPARVEVKPDRIEITEKIQFAYDRDTILQGSFSLLDEVAAVIKKHPHLKKIQIEGHASADGDAGHNQRLSEQRARAVVAYLVGKGVGTKLVPVGYGAAKPIGDNGTREGREQNRRVEFNILEQDPAAGQEKKS
ncbi:MAG: OmpA family protein [Deltaproteobacteria bacterium]|nr:OmpA family protein [Deltaproteobacteria bacterium]